MDAECVRVTAAVTAFYDKLPFNYQSAHRAARAVRSRNQIATTYPDLAAGLERARSVLDVGCGAGWFANTCAHHYGVPVRGIDLSATALARAREVSEELGVAGKTDFRRSNLFESQDDGLYDAVVSLGVLHHTPDLPAAIAAVSRRVAPGGILYLGLYHAPARRPFLQLFDRYRRLARQGRLTERDLDEAYSRYRAIDSRSTDPQFTRSWFRDQVLHPHETQHTLAELAELLAQVEFSIVSTSINRFQAFDRVEELFELEQDYEELSRRRLAEGRYLPGFFTVLARPAMAAAA